MRGFQDSSLMIEAVKQAPREWATCREVKVRIKVSFVSLRECHIVRTLEGTLRRRYRNVTSIDRKVACHQNAARAVGGQALVFSLKASYQLKTGGLVYRPGHWM